MSLLHPVLVPVVCFIRWNEEFEFHLFELTGSEHEIPGSDFVSERFTDLSDPEGRFFSTCFKDVLEVDEHSLRGLRTQVHVRSGTFDWSRLSFEHQVECSRFGEGSRFTARRADVRVI